MLYMVSAHCQCMNSILLNIASLFYNSVIEGYDMDCHIDRFQINTILTGHSWPTLSNMVNKSNVMSASFYQLFIDLCLWPLISFRYMLYSSKPIERQKTLVVYLWSRIMRYWSQHLPLYDQCLQTSSVSSAITVWWDTQLSLHLQLTLYIGQFIQLVQSHDLDVGYVHSLQKHYNLYHRSSCWSIG